MTEKTLVEARLLANASQVEPGTTFLVGLHLKMAPHWHTYWEYGGDAGYPTRVDWKLPEGVKVSGPKWPVPRKLELEGDIQSYAYEDEVMLIYEVTVPAGFAGKSLEIAGKASWLVCEETCIPGSGEVSLSLPIGPPLADNPDVFATWINRLPKAWPAEWKAVWTRDGKILKLRIEGQKLPNSDAVDLFPLPPAGTLIEHPRRLTEPAGIAFEIPLSGDKLPDSIPGILVAGPKLAETDPGRVGYLLPGPSENPVASTPAAPTTSPASGGWLWNLLLGFAGGMILNIMPCVFPVVSLKIYSFMQQAGENRSRIFHLGLAFVAGIFAWFIGLGLLTAGLKIAGSEVSWAFQFQNPYFSLVLAAVVFVFALNLLGVFEILLPGQTVNTLAGVGGDGLGGAFWHGLLATILATPCTAPLLGTALGYAFSQGPATILLMFGAVAAGMGSPYLVLTAFPAWMKFLPRPRGLDGAI